MSGKFGLASGKCQGILFCPVCMNPADVEPENFSQTFVIFLFFNQNTGCGLVILFGHFYGGIWESFPIQKWPLFS